MPKASSHRAVVAASPPGALLDYEGAAKYLCTTPRRVRELWARRRLAGVKVGRSVRFAVEDLDAFIALNRVPAVATRTWR